MSLTGLIPLSNVVNVSVQIAPTGIQNFNVNTLALFTTDSFLINTTNDLYRIYASAQAVGTDFGTATETYSQAVAVFSQQPNILNGSGFLVIVPIQAGAIATAVIRSGGTNYKVGDVLNITEGAAIGGSVTVLTLSGSAVSTFSITTPGINYTALTNLNTVGGAGTGATIDVSTVASETLLQSIQRALNYLYFNGIISTSYGVSTTWKALADSIQATGTSMLFLPSNNVADIQGVFTTISTAVDYNTRCLYYSTSALSSRLFAAAYASRLLGTNFTGSNTAITMNLKQLATIIPDSAINSTLISICTNAGVDLYGNYGGSFPGVLSTGFNKYADEVINLIWLVTSLQVAGFNALATVSTKVPQTEAGISVLKGAYRSVLSQALSNGYIAPGSWTSPDTFGNQSDFLNNISQFGFYIYSNPVALQSSADRVARKAPLIQIAIKEAGAVQSTNVIVEINQ